MTEIDHILTSLSPWERNALMEMGMDLRRVYRPKRLSNAAEQERRMMGVAERMREEQKRVMGREVFERKNVRRIDLPRITLLSSNSCGEA